VAALLFNGSDAEMGEAVRKANESLAEFQQIRRYVRWPDATLPYTSTGKLLRRQVVEWACAAVRGGENAAKPRDSLMQMIAEVTGEPNAQTGDEARLTEDLHLDSLARVQLQSLLESRMGMDLSDDAMAQVKTLGELRRMIRAGAGITEPAPPAAAERNKESQPASSTAMAANAAVQPVEPLAPSREVRAEDRETLSYPRWPWLWPMQCARILFLELIARPLVYLLAAPKATRETEELPDGPMLLIANHVTAYDAPLILYALPGKLRRRVAIAMAGELLADMRHARGQENAFLNALAPIGYWLITALFNVFPLPRLRGFRRSFAHAGEAMDRGYSVLVFPEGHRSETGELQPFRQGIGLLAQQSQVAVLPIVLKGLGELRASGHWLRSGRLAVHVGTPVRLDRQSSATEWTRALQKAFEKSFRETMV
jgi:long-chain acyl-CoA synthetase